MVTPSSTSSTAPPWCLFRGTLGGLLSVISSSPCHSIRRRSPIRHFLLDSKTLSALFSKTTVKLRMLDDSKFVHTDNSTSNSGDQFVQDSQDGFGEAEKKTKQNKTHSHTVRRKRRKQNTRG